MIDLSPAPAVAGEMWGPWQRHLSEAGPDNRRADAIVYPSNGLRIISSRTGPVDAVK